LEVLSYEHDGTSFNPISPTMSATMHSVTDGRTDGRTTLWWE